MGIGKQPDRTNACLICGEPWPRTHRPDFLVIVMTSGVTDRRDHIWMGHADCLRQVVHAGFADYFAKPS